MLRCAIASCCSLSLSTLVIHNSQPVDRGCCIARWKGPEGEDYHFSRVLDFWQPKKGMSPANAHCVQQQRFSVHPGGVFVMQTDMHMEHIPYADCFSVRSFWKVGWCRCSSSSVLASGNGGSNAKLSPSGATTGCFKGKISLL